MHSALTKEEIMQWRRSTEKITLEEFAQKLGKSMDSKKETNDLHDIFLKKKDINEEIEKIEEIKKSAKTKSNQEQAEINEEIQQETSEIQEDNDAEVKINFKKKLNKREETVFNYFYQNKNKIVSVKNLADLLELRNDYVYKYIKNLRSKLEDDVLQNAEQGGYILNI